MCHFHDRSTLDWRDQASIARSQRNMLGNDGYVPGMHFCHPFMDVFDLDENEHGHRDDHTPVEHRSDAFTQNLLDCSRRD